MIGCTQQISSSYDIFSLTECVLFFYIFFNVGTELHFQTFEWIAPRSLVVGRGSSGRITGKMEYLFVLWEGLHLLEKDMGCEIIFQFYACDFFSLLNRVGRNNSGWNFTLRRRIVAEEGTLLHWSILSCTFPSVFEWICPYFGTSPSLSYPGSDRPFFPQFPATLHYYSCRRLFAAVVKTM